MKRPEPNQTVQVFRHGELFFEIRAYRIDDEPSYPGWVTIHGHVHQPDGLFGHSYWWPRQVFAELQEDGSVRMLGKAERLRAKQ